MNEVILNKKLQENINVTQYTTIMNVIPLNNQIANLSQDVSTADEYLQPNLLLKLKGK